MKTGIFVGLCGMDILYYQEALPLENHKSKTNHYNMAVGGPAANAAITYALLGGKAVLVSAIGNSEMGRMIIRELTESYGVEVIDCAPEDQELPSISAITVNVNTGSRTIWSGQAAPKLSDKGGFDDASQLVHQTLESQQQLDTLFPNAHFCLSDCNLPEIALPLLEQAKAKGVAVVLDAGSWKPEMLSYLSAANEVIASAVCQSVGGQDFLSVANQSGVQCVAVTHGEAPIEWETENGRGEIEPPIVQVLDTLGAGDVFHGAFCYYRYRQQLTFEGALKKAAEVAAMSVQYVGARTGVMKYSEMSGGK